MQETITNEFVLNPIDDVLLTRHYLHKNKKAHDLYSQAREKARDEVRTAASEIEKIKACARVEGYEDGMLSCIEAFSDFLADLDELNQNYISRCLDFLRVEAEKVVSDVQVIESLTVKWLKSFNSEHHNHANIFIRMHLSRKNIAAPLCTSLEKMGYHVKIEYDRIPGVSIKKGDYILELNPEGFAHEVSQKGIEKNNDYPLKIKQLSDDFRRKIVEILD